MSFLFCLALVAFRSAPPVTPRRPLLGSPLVNAASFDELPARGIAPHPHAEAPRRAKVWSRTSNVGALLEPIVGARIVPDRGRALDETIASFPEERRALGISALTVGQIQSALCEWPEIDLDLDQDGQAYEARYRIEPFTWSTEPRASLYALSSTCTGALLATGGAVASAVGAGCAAEDEAAHFPAGSRCRACLEIDGDHPRCVAEASCREQMNREMLVAGEFLDVLDITVFACAPRYLSQGFALTHELGEDNAIPGPFEHEKMFAICHWFWKEATQAPAAYCTSLTDTVRPAFADALVGRVEYIRPPGSTEITHAGRFFMASAAELDGVTFDALPLSPESIGPMSESQELGGWGYNPQSLRPDGDTFARDWISVLALKTATKIVGVPVSYINRNTCPEDQWQGPDSLGRYYCKQPYYTNDYLPPDTDIWAYDWGAYVYGADPPDIELRPIITLAATGKPDPKIPGGHVLEMFGAPTLADPDWEDCTWPNLFQPDEMATYSNYDPVYTHTTQTYRFGKDPEIRMVIGSSWRRTFCPGEPQ